jgi:regulator of replication initiation timing
MMTKAQIQKPTIDPVCADLFETIDSRSEGQQLAQEIRCLRTIIAELLIKNQRLRWELQRLPQKMAS